VFVASTPVNCIGYRAWLCQPLRNAIFIAVAGRYSTW